MPGLNGRSPNATSPGGEVHVVPVPPALHVVGEPPGHVLHEGVCDVGRALADEPRHHECRVGIERGERPVAALAGLRGVTLLGADARLNRVGLDEVRRQVAQGVVLLDRTALADLDPQLQHGRRFAGGVRRTRSGGARRRRYSHRCRTRGVGRYAVRRLAATVPSSEDGNRPEARRASALRQQKGARGESARGGIVRRRRPSVPARCRGGWPIRLPRRWHPLPSAGRVKP